MYCSDDTLAKPTGKPCRLSPPLLLGEYVYNEGYTEVKGQIAGIVWYVLVPLSDEKGGK